MDPLMMRPREEALLIEFIRGSLDLDQLPGVSISGVRGSRQFSVRHEPDVAVSVEDLLAGLVRLEHDPEGLRDWAAGLTALFDLSPVGAIRGGDEALAILWDLAFGNAQDWRVRELADILAVEAEAG